MKAANNPVRSRQSERVTAAQSKAGSQAVAVAAPRYGLSFADHGISAGTVSGHPAQLRSGPKDEKKTLPLQGEFIAPVQRAGAAQGPKAAPRKNNTGLPDALKAGVEALSGISFDHVRVHRNSSKPAQLQAHAYAQGSEIHLAPGQERHLPHEAWHVVQQAQGRVKPTLQRKGGVPVNDDAGLEREADVMGARAASLVANQGSFTRLKAGNSSPYIGQRVRYKTGARTGRVNKPPFAKAIEGKDHFGGPTYASCDIAGAGGALSTATLGPTGSWLSSGSDANANLPSYIVEARAKYPLCNFKAGHLLNAQFGGDGKSARNLTILSATGNSNHKAFDEPVKNAIAKLREAYRTLWENNIDINIQMGISVSIAVNTEQPWEGETKIFQGLTCTAKVTDWEQMLAEFDDEGMVEFDDEGMAEVENKRLKNEFTAHMTGVVNLCAKATSDGHVQNPNVASASSSAASPAFNMGVLDQPVGGKVRGGIKKNNLGETGRAGRRDSRAHNTKKRRADEKTNRRSRLKEAAAPKSG